MRWFNIAKLLFITTSVVAWIFDPGNVFGQFRLPMVVTAVYLFLPEAFVFYFHTKTESTFRKILKTMYWSNGQYETALPAMRVDLRKTTIQILIAVGGFVLAFSSGRPGAANTTVFVTVMLSVMLGIFYAFVLDGGIQSDTSTQAGNRLITVPSGYQKVLEILLTLQVAALLFGLTLLTSPSAQQRSLTADQIKSYLAGVAAATETAWPQDPVVFARAGGVDVYIKVKSAADVLIKTGEKIQVQSRLAVRREVQDQLASMDQLLKVLRDEKAAIERVSMSPEIEGYQKGVLLELQSRLGEIENRRKIFESKLHITSPLRGTVIDINPILSTTNSVYFKVVVQP